jgi:ribosomal protein L24E
MIAFRKATKGMLCDDIYIHMWSLIRKEFEEYSQIPPTDFDMENGQKYWTKNNKDHRLFDLPAYEYYDYDKEWSIDGKHHRDWDLPAIISSDMEGNYYRLEWYKNGVMHRDTDEPAEIFYGYSYWYKNGKIHREGDKPAIIFENTMMWVQNDILYREDNKPTVVRADGTMIWATSEKIRSLEYIISDTMWCGQRNFQLDPDGTMRWFINNKPGRENDEPAVIYPNGTQIWYSNCEIKVRHRSINTSVIHRDGGKPAIICKDGSMSWFEKGKLVKYIKHGKKYTPRSNFPERKI